MSDTRERVSSALLLRKVDYGEADLVVTLLTEDLGKRTMFARSARKSRKRFAGGLEPLRLMQVRYRDARSDNLAQLFETRVLESFDPIARDLHQLYWASLALEWIQAMTVDGEASPVFEVAVELFRWLSHETRGPWFVESGCLRFGLVLLAHAGFLPELGRCVRTGTEVARIETPLFSAIEGGVLDGEVVRPDDRARPVSKEALAFLDSLYAGRFPHDRQVEALREARDLVIDIYRTIVDAEPRSLAMLRSVWV